MSSISSPRSFSPLFLPLSSAASSSSYDPTLPPPASLSNSSTPTEESESKNIASQEQNSTEEDLIQVLEEMNNRLNSTGDDDLDKSKSSSSMKSSSCEMSPIDDPYVLLGVDTAVTPQEQPQMQQQPQPPRSRPCSANSTLSFDSAIADVYVKSPKNSHSHGSDPPPSLPPPPPPPPQMSSQHHVPVIKMDRDDDRLMLHRQEVDAVCVDLVLKFRNACHMHPKPGARGWIAANEDPLLITTRLLSEALTRLRIFLFGLEPMTWLSWHDRNVLYSAGVCAAAIFKASASVDLSTLPSAYPLPYGEYLGEVEALHLILAHDLYNELKALVAHIQTLLGGCELPVTLLVMMVSFFTPQTIMMQPEKVMKIHDYFTHKLQLYLSLRFGPVSGPPLFTKIMDAVERAKNFSFRLREFMQDVTNCGLQKQYESVCENIGLMAFLLQSEPSLEQLG